MREIEAKFRVHSPFQVPELTGEGTGVSTVDEPVSRELRAVYWDTSDLRLAREGITLRHRSGEGDGDGWHLKLPVQEAGVPDASTGVREELHETGDNDAVPVPLQELVTVQVRGAVLGPVATLVTSRSTYLLRGSANEVRAELTDDVVAVLNQGHVAGRFREIEVESVDGDADLLKRVGDALRAAGAVGGEFVPKVVRALGPQATADPDPPPPAHVELDGPARLALQAILRRYVRAFMAQDPRLRRDEPDSVHQMRVSARRLRSALKSFAPLVDDAWAKSLREELAWVADSLGHARDSEVLLARLHRELDQLPQDLVLGQTRARIDSEVGGDLEAARAKATQILRTDRYIALVDRLVDAAWDPLTTRRAEDNADEVLREAVESSWQRLARKASSLSTPGASNHDWHEARIAAKQLRYAAEAVTPTFGKSAKRLAARAEQIQELLGEHQDAVVAASTLRRLATAPRAGATAFTLGLMYARQQDAIARARKQFPAIWSEASKPTYRKWLRG